MVTQIRWLLLYYMEEEGLIFNARKHEEDVRNVFFNFPVMFDAVGFVQ